MSALERFQSIVQAEEPDGVLVSWPGALKLLVESYRAGEIPPTAPLDQVLEHVGSSAAVGWEDGKIAPVFTLMNVPVYVRTHEGGVDDLVTLYTDEET